MGLGKSDSQHEQVDLGMLGFWCGQEVPFRSSACDAEGQLPSEL